MFEILKNYLKKEDYYIIIYQNLIYIYNYLEIVKFTDTNILLKLKNFNININGSNLLIIRMEKKELLIKGIIYKVEKLYE